MAKKNYRPRVPVKVRKQQQREAERRAFFKKWYKQIIIGAVAVVAAILIIVFAVDYFHVPAGSLRTFMGNVMDVKPNAIVRELDGNYYELGTLDLPEGYVAEDYVLPMATDNQEQYLYYVAQDEGRAVNNVYASGVKNRKGADMVAQLLEAGNYYETTSGARSGEVAGHAVNYFYAQSPLGEGEDALYNATLVLYVDTIRDSSLLINFATADMPKADLPTEEAMLAEAEVILAGLKLPQ